MAHDPKTMLYTPKGTAIHPWITRPDTKFNPDGDYKVDLQLSREDAQELIDNLEAIHKEWIAEEQKRTKKKPKVSPLPIADVTDDDGNETGDVLIKFKAKAKITTKAGKIINVTIPLMDSKGKTVKGEVQIFGGSKIKVCYQAVPYNTAVGCGLTLRLIGVQIIDLVSGGGRSFNFGEEEGFEADDNDTSASDDDTPDDADNF